ncbi:hypothetical protein [Pedobacter sp. GR22-6]|uniref:hypothetical protein n=1 Tax=Pedobacter sp. GR22-6 TaxID=3127957 RepID=UPI00307CFD1B
MYDRLKTNVLKRAGITHLNPADCKHLSEDIYHAVRKTVSITTLKRFFGFASLNFHFSKYTLNTLAEYAEGSMRRSEICELDPEGLPIKVIEHIEFELDDGTLLSCNCFKEATFVEFKHVTADEDRACFILKKHQVEALLHAVGGSSK